MMIRFGALGALMFAMAACSPRAVAAPAVGIGVSRAVTRVVHRPNRWRYAWHNDRWWYWTANGSWDYFDGRNWRSYDSRRPLSGSLARGYRKAPAFESPPAAPPLRPFVGDAQTDDIELDLAEPFRAETIAPSLPTPLRVGKSFGGFETPGRAIPKPLPGVGRGRAGAAASGGGGFGGPTGRSLGAGGAAGGASLPQ